MVDENSGKDDDECGGGWLTNVDDEVDGWRMSLHGGGYGGVWRAWMSGVVR